MLKPGLSNSMLYQSESELDTNVETNGNVRNTRPKSVSVNGSGEATFVRKDDEGVWRALTATLAMERGYGLDGAFYLLDQVSSVEPLWGTPERCLWSKGEPFYIFAPPSTGKSTLIQQLALRRAGVRGGDLLGLPVEVDPRKILYIAADRPQQVKRSWGRMVSESDREALSLSTVVWPQAPPFTLPTQPDRFLPWVKTFGEIGTVFVDSLFNVAPSVTDEDGAANTNNAMQSLVRSGIEVVVIHHDRKRDAKDRKRVFMDDMYGGRPLTGGAGSIVYIDGEPGTLKGTLRHLKPPAGIVGAIDFRQFPRTGEMTET